MAAEAGAHLLIATVDELAGWELVQQTGAELWLGDLARPTAAGSVLAQCLAKFGRVDALFNVAGQSGRRFGDGAVHECSDDGWDAAILRNLTIAFQMCRAVAGRMLDQRPDDHGSRGAIVNLGSVLVDAPEPRHFATHAYAAAKGGVAALTRSMAAYYAPHGIRVNLLSPGIVRTPASERTQTDAALLEFIGKKQPLTAGMTGADDVARAALFLLGDDARSLTGQTLNVDGGWSVTGV
jgi:NAD(P)-dependent dehydrogenase (short-subunit alcohol dehydrogenase family)